MKDPVRGYVTFFVVIGLIAAGAGTGACSNPRAEKDVRNPDPLGKIPAYKEAVREGDRSAVRQMVEDLDSDDPAIRMFAIIALRRLTNGETFGYEYFEDEDQRRPAVERWEAWLAGKNPNDGPQDQAATGTSGATERRDSASGR